MIGLFGWFWILYFSAGFFIMFEAMVTVWDNVDEIWWIKVVGSILALITWPLSFLY